MTRADLGTADEDTVAGWLRDRGQDVMPWGARLWDPREPAVRVSGPRIRDSAHRCRLPLRWGPDLIAGDGFGWPRFVEVINDPRAPNTGNHLLELSKLSAFDAWSIIAPVYVVNAATGKGWIHVPHAWPGYTTHVDNTHPGNGSGTTYVLARPPAVPIDYLFTGGLP